MVEAVAGRAGSLGLVDVLWCLDLLGFVGLSAAGFALERGLSAPGVALERDRSKTRVAGWVSGLRGHDEDWSVGQESCGLS